MKLKEYISLPCSLRFMVEDLELQSSASRRKLMEQEMMTAQSDIEQAYNVLRSYFERVKEPKQELNIKTLQFRLAGIKDLRTTIQNMAEHRVLDDIELFEIKHLAILTGEVEKQMDKTGIACSLPDLDDVVAILDPEGLRIATFYIYDAYSDTLRDIRRQREKEPQNEDLFVKMQEEEELIRQELSRQLQPMQKKIAEAYMSLIDIDITLAKALQIKRMGLCFPVIGVTTGYTDMWQPEVKELLRARHREYQANSISFGNNPTLIIGSNMGGKTVVLQTVALCQLLTQFGFGVPAREAQVALKDEVLMAMADGQSIESGLSSFGAEMLNINNIITAARMGKRVLALIDEPARTTNPIEGTALVNGLLEVLVKTGQSIVVVTHYNVSAADCRCYRVRGLENGKMNYALEATTANTVPHEALAIARELGIDDEWLERTEEFLREE